MTTLLVNKIKVTINKKKITIFDYFHDISSTERDSIENYLKKEGFATEESIIEIDSKGFFAHDQE